MYYLKKISFISLIGLILIILNGSCVKKPFSKIKWEGYVLDTIGGNPVKGIWVQLYGCSQGCEGCCSAVVVGQQVTDDKGYFKIEDEPVATDQYFVNLDGQEYFGNVNGAAVTNTKTICLRCPR